MIDRDFDWHRDPSVAVPDQPGIRVCINVHGNIAIVQRADVYETEDAVVVVNVIHALALARAIVAAAGIEIEALSGADFSGPAAAEPKDKTAAERMRRYRARQREGIRGFEQSVVSQSVDADMFETRVTYSHQRNDEPSVTRNGETAERNAAPTLQLTCEEGSQAG